MATKSKLTNRARARHRGDGAEHLCIGRLSKSGKVQNQEGLRAIIWVAKEIAKILFEVDVVYAASLSLNTSRKATANRADAADLPASQQLFNRPDQFAAQRRPLRRSYRVRCDPVDLGIECGCP